MDVLKNSAQGFAEVQRAENCTFAFSVCEDKDGTDFVNDDDQDVSDGRRLSNCVGLNDKLCDGGETVGSDAISISYLPTGSIREQMTNSSGKDCIGMTGFEYTTCLS